MMNRQAHTENSLSSAQQRLWVLSKFDRADYLYNVPLILALPQDTDFVRLQKAFEQLLQKHPQLSVSFIERADAIYQVNTPAVSIKIEKLELRDALNSIVDLTSHTILADFFMQPFDLSQAPLLRVAIAQSHEQSYLCISCHHLIIDAWSTHLFLQELYDIYARPAVDSQLAQVTTSYAAYVEWEQDQLKNNRYTAELTYWKNRLANKAWVVDLITDYPRRKYQSGAGSNYVITFDNETFDCLNTFARQQQVTANHVILSVFQILLGRYSGQESIYLGMPTANRTQKQWQQTIGLFINTFIHGYTLDYNISFNEHLQQIKRLLLEDIARSNIPYDHLMQHFYEEKICQQGASFNVLYNYVQLNSHSDLFCLLPISKFDLSLHALMSQSDVKLIFEYSTELFRKETIEQLARHFKKLLITLTRQSQQSISELLWMLNDR